MQTGSLGHQQNAKHSPSGPSDSRFFTSCHSPHTSLPSLQTRFIKMPSHRIVPLPDSVQSRANSTCFLRLSLKLSDQSENPRIGSSSHPLTEPPQGCRGVHFFLLLQGAANQIGWGVVPRWASSWGWKPPAMSPHSCEAACARTVKHITSSLPNDSEDGRL